MDNCPYHAIIQAMPFPFAVFNVRKNSWILTSFNRAFQSITKCSIGDSVEDFPFEIKEERSEIEIGQTWYSIHQFKYQPDAAVLFFYDVTAKHGFDSLLPQIMQKAAMCI